jgi:hypothetical protein
LLVLFLVEGSTVGAATIYTVTRTDDPSPNGCLPGDCSLREAIVDANSNSGRDVVALGAGTYQMSIAGAVELDQSLSGDLDISDDMELMGVSAETTIIDGGGLDRVIDIRSQAEVLISDVSIRNGDGSFGGNPGGGGIRNKGELTLQRSVVRDNAASGGGGGIQNDPGSSSGTVARLYIVDSVIRDNSAQYGGGIESHAPILQITKSEVINNVGSNGPSGIYGGIVELNQVLVAGNTGPYGGAIAIDGFGSLKIYNSVVRDNSGSGVTNSQAQFILVDGTEFSGHPEAGFSSSSGPVTVLNSTFSGNDIGLAVGNGDIVLTHVTVADNDIGLAYDLRPSYTLQLENSVLDGNLTNCAGLESLQATHTSSSDGSCQLTGSANHAGVSANLAPLTENGGFSRTHMPLANSIARDSAADSYCPTVDQRGVTRPLDGNGDGVPSCDRGAVEASFAVGGFVEVMNARDGSGLSIVVLLFGLAVLLIVVPIAYSLRRLRIC